MTTLKTSRRHLWIEYASAAWLRVGVVMIGVFVPAVTQGQAFDGQPLVTDRSRTLARDVAVGTSLLPSHERYVIVHLTENRLFVMEDERAIWSAPVGTGTGFNLTGAGQKWHFSTPSGIMKVRRKERDPVWIAPDWHFVERGVPVPPLQHPSRRIPGALGTTAIYLGDGIAIHGTFRPELVLDPDPERRRISHGCIRLTNEAARELYYLVDVGTPVLIY
jgi:lipoprotein-anchoring transpeptidase ErfK/SrfK